MESTTIYIPIDRRQAIARGEELPDRTSGAALFADISGFTPFTTTLLNELGPKRGPEELTRQLNLVYDALVTEVHRYGGSVMVFSGDAITCWLDGDEGLRAIACGLAMQRAMAQFSAIQTPAGNTVSLDIKVAIATGPVRRFRAGDPGIQYIDALTGVTLDRMVEAEHHAQRGDVVVDSATAARFVDQITITKWRDNGRFAVVEGLKTDVLASPWPEAPPQQLTEAHTRPWLLPPVYERLSSGQGRFLAELRSATALFLRFGGIGYDQDEAAGDKLDAYVWWVQGVLAQYEAYLLQLTIGDKGSYLYAAFGAPVAHEDDAVRAMYAALELQRPPGSLEFISETQIGLSQGQMLTGAYGGANRCTYGVLGEEVNMAARLMQAAQPGQILVAQSAQRLAAEEFVWRELPPLNVKGKTDSIIAFSLEGKQERRAIHFQGARYALPMVGRKSELALIEQKLDLALQGQGQIVGITGEAGIGKSRLLADAIRLANNHQVTGFASECESYGTNTSYLVWRVIWRELFALDPSWETDVQIQELQKQLAQIDPTLIPRLPLLGSVLNLPIPDNDLTRSFDAKLRKSSLEALLVDYLRARAKRSPLFLVLEDCHWLDPLSHDLLEEVGRAVADLPVLLILAYRPPEAQRLQAPRVSQLAYFTEIRLTEFTPQEAEQLIGLKLSQFTQPDAATSPELVKRITTRAEGNPFYIEELMNYLRDRGINPHDTQALERLDLPTSLHSLIISRLDQRTERQKTILRVASVVGRLFQATLIWGMYPDLGNPERVKADLETLCDLDLTQVDTPEPELAYLFKHIVTQEVAYESLPYATRALLHDQLGQFIEKTYHNKLSQYVDLLAFHFDHSENEPKKREYLLKAGEAAQSDYANQTAIDYYRRVLPLLPETEQVAVMQKLGDVLELTGEWDGADEQYRQALGLATQQGDQLAQAWCQAALGEFRGFKQGEFTEASQWLEQARSNFEQLENQAGVGQVLHTWGTLAAQQGDFDEARDLWEKSLSIRYSLVDKQKIGALLSNLGILARLRGDLDKALALQEESLKLRQTLGDKWAIAISLNNLGNVYLDEGDYVAARTQLEAALDLQRQIGDRYAIANALHSLANVTRDQGDYTASRAQYEESLQMLRTLGEKWLVAHILEDMGGLAAMQGQSGRALTLAGTAKTLRESIGAPISPAYKEKLDHMLEPAQQALGETETNTALANGRSMTLEQALDYALQED